MPIPALVRRMPSHVINGVGVSIGVALAYLAGHVLGGPVAAVTASSGAVYASLADVPNPPARTWRRVLPAALIGCLVSLVVGALKGHVALMGLAIGLVGAVSMMTLAWGPRAGPMSFVGVMAFVFTMAAPKAPGAAALFVSAGWVAFGGLLYLGWAMLATTLVQPRYRTLALAAVFDATAQLLRARAALVAESARIGGRPTLQTWIDDDTVLDERTQAARDLLFAAPDGDTSRRQTALLVLAIDLRDTLLLTQLDLNLLGHDGAGQRARAGVAMSLTAVADALEELGEALRAEGPLPRGEPASILRSLSDTVFFADADPRGRLVPVLVDRTRHMAEDLTRMRALMQGESAELPIARGALQLFVSVEGWPLAALRPHATLQSPVTRHAVRAGIALAAAYFIGEALPWASHPHWLVLSVAVVLRGSLEQTLARRNLRVAGTLAGCILVLVIAKLATPWFSTLAYLLATGLAHAFTVVRYFVTALAATVMALLQDHLASPERGFAVLERFADTLLGAVLAWAFSYVLPSWERRGVARLTARLVRALKALSDEALRLPEPGGTDLALRLARREVYEALRGLALAAQRSSVEPASVRLPLQAFATLLSESHALLAHLAAVKVTVTRRGSELDADEIDAALRVTAAALAAALDGTAAAKSAPAVPVEIEAELPAQAPRETVTPWLHRRLRRAALAGARVSAAAGALRAAAAR